MFSWQHLCARAEWNDKVNIDSGGEAPCDESLQGDPSCSLPSMLIFPVPIVLQMDVIYCMWLWYIGFDCHILDVTDLPNTIWILSIVFFLCHGLCKLNTYVDLQPSPVKKSTKIQTENICYLKWNNSMCFSKWGSWKEQWKVPGCMKKKRILNKESSVYKTKK
jgi:hypothetical protein